METRYYKQSKNGPHYKAESSSSLIINWLAVYKSAEFVITEVQSDSTQDFADYEAFYVGRLEQLENTLLSDPEDWEVQVGDYYEGEDEFDPDKIMKRKAKLFENLQNLIPVQ